MRRPYGGSVRRRTHASAFDFRNSPGLFIIVDWWRWCLPFPEIEKKHPMSNLKTQIVAWTFTLALPLALILGAYVFITARSDREGVEMVKQDVAENRKDIRDTKAQVAVHENRLADHGSRLDRAEKSITEHGERIGKAEKDVDSCKSAIEANAEEFGKYRREMEAKTADLKAEIEKLKDQSTEELAFRKDALKRIEELGAEIRELAKKLSEFQEAASKRLDAVEEKTSPKSDK